MYTRNSLIWMKNFLLLFFISLVVSFSPGSFLKAQEQEEVFEVEGGEEVETPAPEATPATQAPSVLATADGEDPGVRVEVQQLKRNSGGTVTLRFSLINDSDKGFDINNKLGGSNYSGFDVSLVHLVDAVGKKKYLVILDSEEKCLCSNNISASLGPGSRMNLWAKFPAPPENVEKITVVIPHFIPMDDVPIS
jgi:hypothetical protein